MNVRHSVQGGPKWPLPIMPWKSPYREPPPVLAPTLTIQESQTCSSLFILDLTKQGPPSHLTIQNPTEHVQTCLSRTTNSWQVGGCILLECFLVQNYSHPGIFWCWWVNVKNYQQARHGNHVQKLMEGFVDCTGRTYYNAIIILACCTTRSGTFDFILAIKDVGKDRNWNLRHLLRFAWN